MNSPVSVAKRYSAKTGSLFDEMLGDDEHVVDSWKRFYEIFNSLSPKQRDDLPNETQRLLSEIGATYTLLDDEQAEHRPWTLDPVPLILENQEWTEIEAGLQQRVELLNAVLKDIYSEQTLIKEGLLPMELVHSHAGFFRPCQNMLSPDAVPLVLHAADLSRGPDGRMWIINDRSEAPSGAGYALENRLVTTSVIPRTFRACQPQRLVGFFRELQHTLESLDPSGSRSPRIVVLTPGPYSETYFEQAYLAAYLGYTLVQGEDLTVRDGKVWLRSLGGLERVHVILRRVDSYYCDPLELYADSRLGVSGLLEAMRLRNVAVVNAPGSGVLENPALHAFLPGMCRHLRGEELLMPSAATWWCGQESAKAHVLANLEKMVIKSISRRPNLGTVFGSRASKQELEDLRSRILAEPTQFAGQEEVAFSTAPTLINGELEPRRNVFRAFTASNADGGYSLMPGGLTRVATEHDGFLVSTQAGGISKDTWITGRSAEPYASLWDEEDAGGLDADASNLPSRSGENLFWAGRYSERCEGTARLVRHILRCILNASSSDSARVLQLITTLRNLTQTRIETDEADDAENAIYSDDAPWRDSYLSTILTDTKTPGSLPYTIKALIRSAYGARDLWSSDSWRAIGALEKLWSNGELSNLSFYVAPLNQLINGLVALTGLTLESMPRDAGWLLLDTGRRIERSQFLINLLHSMLEPGEGSPREAELLESILTISESLTAYRRRYRGQPRLASVVEFLLFDPLHTRSLFYQLERIKTHLPELPQPTKSVRLPGEQRLILDAHTRLQLSDSADLLEANGSRFARRRLLSLLEDIGGKMNELSNAVTHRYFQHFQQSQF